MQIKIGDVIRVTTDSKSSFFKPGTKARVVEIDDEGDPWANFSDMGNPEGSFRTECGGIWCVNPERCEVMEAAQ